MPFGLRNAAQTFQRFIDQVLMGFDFVYAYIDDLLVAKADVNEHEQYLRQLFQRLDYYGIAINPEKSVFGQPSVKFLGHIVDAVGIRPTEDKISQIRDFPVPKTLK